MVHIPTWKKWLSHLTSITLEETGSEQNPDLMVALHKGRVQLLAGNAIYSWDDLYHNFRLAFEQLDLDKHHIQEVLILGLGLGSIPFMLETVFHKNYYYTAIEWDEEVANLALKYTFPRLKSSVDVVTADAELFVEVCEETFGLVIIDIFEDDLTPPQFETEAFLDACDRLLSPGGLLLFNRLHNISSDKVATERFFYNTFLGRFPSGYKLDTKGNWILVYEKGDL